MQTESKTYKCTNEENEQEKKIEKKTNKNSTHPYNTSQRSSGIHIQLLKKNGNRNIGTSCAVK